MSTKLTPTESLPHARVSTSDELVLNLKLKSIDLHCARYDGSSSTRINYLLAESMALVRDLGELLSSPGI